MLELTSAGRPVRLSPGTSAQLEYHSPLFDEDTILGSFAYSFAVPAGPNGPLYGYPERPDAATAPGTRLPAELATDGVPLLIGTQRVKAASAAKYSVQVAGGLSGAGLSERQLSSFSYGGLREVPQFVATYPVNPYAPLMPGLTRHANEVVANPAAYDYVFAPLRNEYAGLFGEFVNPWHVETISIVGLPVGGSFYWNLNFQVPGGIPNADFRVLPLVCPWPRLRYVLRCICEEAGLVVDPAKLLPGELGELVFVGNSVLVDRGDAETLRFSLADALPALTVAELLAALRQDLGVVVYVDPATGRVRSAYLHERVAVEAGYVDLSDRVVGSVEVALDDDQGLTLTVGIDSNDELTKDYLDQQPDPSRLLPPVATVADLPATADILAQAPRTGQVRLVEAEDTYYSCTVGYVDFVNVTLSWSRLVPALPSIEVNGGGETQAQRICSVAEALLNVSLVDPTITFPVPAISLPVFAAGGEQERGSALRLLFYHGLQPASDGVSLVPALSHRSPSGALSLRLSGEQGTYAQLLAGWLPVKLRGTSYAQQLRLSALDLARLDLSRPMRLDGVPYLVRKLTATAPLRKPVAAELVRLF